MRIRKCASKLLGSADAYASPPPWSASTESLDSQATAAAGLLCELNRSPWDLIPNIHSSSSSSIAAFQEEEKEEVVDRGIMGNGIKLEEELIPPNRRSKEKMKEEEEEEEEEESEEKKDKKKKKKKKKKKIIGRKRKEKEIETGSATATEATVSCKKSDGKGWHCKRPADLPHSLCQYHLAQLRSYSYNHSKAANSANGGQARVQRKKGDATGDGSNLFYYYAGFGPWRGKRRGDSTADAANGNDSANKEEEGEEEKEKEKKEKEKEKKEKEEEEEEEEEGRENSKRGGEHNAPVASDDDEEDDEGDGRGRGDDDDSGDDSSDGEKNRNRRKRGRKPVKARSLKSLL